MAEQAVQKVIADIQALSPEQREEVRRFLNGTPVIIAEVPEPPIQAKSAGHGQAAKVRAGDYEWLRQHSGRYANQWVALNGGRLVSHGKELKDVIAKARQVGESDALVIFVEPTTAPPFLMLWS